VSCLACDVNAGRVEAPGGLILDTGLWAVDHCVGPLGVGTLVVKPKRHVVHVGELAPDEAAELGPLLRRTAAVVMELASPEQVYVCLWSHAGGEPGHVHFVVQPVTRELMAALGSHGPRLQVTMFDRGELPDPSAAAAFAARARRLLADKS
jgi:diadenosine tetraphosphate (Ap4A) HIT family hydrolase